MKKTVGNVGEHTPGPWGILETKIEGVKETTLIIVPENFDADMAGAKNAIAMIGNTNAGANAYLIAAAPMLEKALLQIEEIANRGRVKKSGDMLEIKAVINRLFE